MSRHVRWLAGSAFGLAALSATLLAAPTAHADAPSLQLAPLEYVDNLTTAVESGYIDVSNPTDAAVNVSSQVRGFRQRGTAGDLDFFDDPDLAAGVTVGLPAFELGPREAIRVAFTIDPGKLPHGALYGVIFFHTVPVAQSSASSFVTQSTSVGTLLELNNGATLQPGTISTLKLPFWQFGGGLLGGSVSYRNPGHARADAGIRPKLSSRVLPWGHPVGLASGLVLPGTTRQFTFSHPGAYLGLLPVTVTDADTGRTRTAWILACTGWWRVLFPILLIVVVILLFALRHRLYSLLNVRFRRRHHLVVPARHNLDGLVLRSAQVSLSTKAAAEASIDESTITADDPDESTDSSKA